MSVIRWEKPPHPSHAARHDWAAIGRELVSRPMQWALVVIAPNGSAAGQVAARIKRSAYGGLKDLPGAFQAVSRNVDNEARVYARWIGESS